MCLLAETRAFTLSQSETTEDVGYLGDMYMGNICKGDKCLFPQVDDVEIAIPLEQLPAAMKDIKQITDATKVCFPVFGIYVRFGLASKNTLLGPARNHTQVKLIMEKTLQSILSDLPVWPATAFASLNSPKSQLAMTQKAYFKTTFYNLAKRVSMNSCALVVLMIVLAFALLMITAMQDTCARWDHFSRKLECAKRDKALNVGVEMNARLENVLYSNVCECEKKRIKMALSFAI